MVLKFTKSANPFYNAGIIGFYRNCQDFLDMYGEEYSEFNILPISKNDLILEYSASFERLLSFLEAVYYHMGRRYYDTATEKQLNNPENIYFTEDNEQLVPHLFPKMNTYGLGHLFTNNAQGTTIREEDSIKFEALKKENPEKALQIEEVFKAKKIKLLSKLYFNGPYTKITRLTLSSKLFQEGENLCPITGDKYKTLVEAKNISPFISGVASFNSHLSVSEKKISWKALYIIRFAPSVCFYSYQDNYKTFVGHLFEAGNLEALQNSYISSLYFQRDVLEKSNYQINFDLKNFEYARKDGDKIQIGLGKDVSWPSEITFMLLYRFYTLFFKSKITEETVENDIFTGDVLEKIPLSLITFKASEFGSTLRPDLYEEYDQLMFIFRFFYHMEHIDTSANVQLKDIWSGLKCSTDTTESRKRRNFSEGHKLERKIRSQILEAILKRQSILSLFEDFYFTLFGALLDGQSTGYRNYRMLLNFFKLYQNLVPMSLDKELQEYAINLGVSIGQGIVRYENPDGGDTKTNIKIGRKYIIDLRNARTIEQFLQAVERIMFKYNINVKKDLLSNISNQNFILIKQFAVIGALNQINPKLNNISQTDQNQ